MDHSPVAFIGLGALGAPMAANLLAASVRLTVHNRGRERETPLARAGAQVADRPAAAAAGARVVLLCLSDGPAVEEVLFGPEGVVAGLAATTPPPGSPPPLVVDFSTIEPSRARSLAARLAARGIAWLDAPVTGGTEGARAGTLSVLVGGDADTLERARPLLEVIGGTITHFGPAGAGQQAKAINQILVAGSYAAVAEAMALARRLGLPMDDLRRALSCGAAGSWALDHRAAGMIAGRFPLGFRLALHRKDLAIALAAAAETGLELPVCRTVAAMEDDLLAAGHGDEDVSALARWFSAPPDAPREDSDAPREVSDTPREVSETPREVSEDLEPAPAPARAASDGATAG
ncbi:MAG: NAD(P)-dependent oxidoreductase [Cyanobacteriota bacterium]|nr:NAD(P)-dependent oxidoreductase [Cyanobacteriota bacterium]